MSKNILFTKHLWTNAFEFICGAYFKFFIIKSFHHEKSRFLRKKPTSGIPALNVITDKSNMIIYLTNCCSQNFLFQFFLLYLLFWYKYYSKMFFLFLIRKIFSWSIARFRSSHQRCSVRKGVLRNLAKVTGKHLCQSLFFNKVAGLRPAALSKRDSGTGVFLWILQNF